MGSFGQRGKWFHFVRVGEEMGSFRSAGLWGGMALRQPAGRLPTGRRMPSCPTRMPSCPTVLGSFGKDLRAARFAWLARNGFVSSSGFARVGGGDWRIRLRVGRSSGIVPNSRIEQGLAGTMGKCFVVLEKLPVTGSRARASFAVGVAPDWRKHRNAENGGC